MIPLSPYFQWSNYRKISKGAHTQRRKSVHNFGGTDIGKTGGTDIEKIGKSASAVGAKLRLPKVRSPSRLGGLGERRELPSGIWDEAPETEAILNILFQNGVHFWILLISYLARGPNYVMRIWDEAPMGLRGNGVQGLTLDQGLRETDDIFLFQRLFSRKIITDFGY